MEPTCLMPYPVEVLLSRIFGHQEAVERWHEQLRNMLTIGSTLYHYLQERRRTSPSGILTLTHSLALFQTLVKNVH